MKDLGHLMYVLGIEVAPNASGLYLSQRKYALDIISETRLSRSETTITPIEQNHHLAKATGSFLSSPDHSKIGRPSDLSHYY